MKNRIYLSPPHMGPDERDLLLDAFDSNWVAPLGPHVEAFEREIAAFCRAEQAAALSSGTAALHLALILLGVGRGDRVFCSTFTFAATSNPILYCGADPVFIDSDRASWNIDPDLLEEELELASRGGKLPKAVIAVDLYGQCADYDRISASCDRFGVPLIEDAAEALGSTYRGRPAGSFGRMAALSFNGNKIITTSGGGMLLSADSDLVSRGRFLATQAREPYPHYEHLTTGYNYRMSNLLAAVGRGQLRHLDQRVSARRAIFDRYERELGTLEGVEFMPEADYGQANRWLTCLVIDEERFGADREAVRLALERDDVEARPLWKPMHLQPLYSGCRVVGGVVSEQLFAAGLCLPSGSNLTAADQSRVIDIVAAART
jgi:dTDP-4-amino-4,6-dideoxygalactose transaminase